MTPVNSRPPELALPVASLAALRRELAAAAGGDAAARALQSAGDAAGEAFFRALAHGPASVGGDAQDAVREALAKLDQGTFWRRFAEVFASRGWGHVAMEPIHPGIGALDSTDWVEADDAGTGSRPSCFFTTGLLANLLGRVAGEEIAVLEVECRSRGDARCRFLFGGPVALDELFQRIRSGAEVDDSLAQLV